MPRANDIRIRSKRRRSPLATDRLPNSSSTVPDHHVASPVDGFATVASLDLDDDSLYGESSTIAFARRIAHEHGRNEVAGQRSKTSSRRYPPPEPIRERNESAAFLPRRRNADEYVSCYFNCIHPVFPILHKPSFMASYEQLWTSENTQEQHESNSELDDVLFLSTSNLVFALGCQFSKSVPDTRKITVAEEFYQRSRDVFIYDVLDSTTISMVQMLLLTAIYLQSTKYASRCWNTVGLAIRVAQSLGLHSDWVQRRPENQVAREMRRRVWHTCLTLDG
jgi:DNA polymerase III psi subunit